MKYSYQGVSGILLKVEDKYCPDMGAFQVASILNESGSVDRVSNKYDTTHNFPALPVCETRDQVRTRMNKHWLKRASVFSATGTRTGRLLALIAAGKVKLA